MIYYKKSGALKRLSWQRRVLQECKASWWVVLFAIFTYMLSSKTLDAKDIEIARLAKQLKILEQDRVVAEQRREGLSLQIKSQKDPLWVEKVLIRKLGLIPEGYIKVRFNKEDQAMQSYIDG